MSPHHTITSSASISLAVARACQLIERWTGITLSGAAPRRLHEFLERRASTLGYEHAMAYLQHIQLAPRDHPEVTRLINLVTNGLTAFWRDAPQLDAARLAMQQLASTRSTPLQIWCAGCSTGEEAYTLAMLTLEVGCTAHVLGTDLNTDSLQSARDRLFSAWSLRRLDPARTTRFFEKLDEDRFMVRDALAQRVSFLRHNLLDPPPEPPGGGSGWDLIVCRNVLIYFGDETLRAVIDRFASTLDLDGYLMLGSSEQLNAYYDAGDSLFRAAQHGAGFVYRLRAKAPGSTIYKLPLLRESTTARPSHWQLSTATEHLTELSEETVELNTDAALLALLRAGLQQLPHDLEGALANFEAASGYDPFSTDAHYAAAHAIRTHAPRRAAEGLRKVLFLDPLHWRAALDLATLHEALGDVARARALYRQTLEGIHQRATPLFDITPTHERFEPTDAERQRALASATARHLATSTPT